MGDLREDLVETAAGSLVQRHDSTITGDDCSMCGDYPRKTAAQVIDSIPPGAYKNEKREWVKLDQASVEALLASLGWSRIGHQFVPKADGPCDCAPDTSWDPHYTCADCGAYDSHTIHHAGFRSWRPPLYTEVTDA